MDISKQKLHSACLNKRYLPPQIERFLISPDLGWHYQKGKFCLDLRPEIAAFPHIKDYTRILREKGVYPIFLKINERNPYYKFILFEDEVRMASELEQSDNVILSLFLKEFNYMLAEHAH